MNPPAVPHAEAGFVIPRSWLITCAVAVIGAFLNHQLSVVNNGRLTFMLLWPAVVLGGFFSGLWSALIAALIGAIAVMVWHPEMKDGRTVAELGASDFFWCSRRCSVGSFNDSTACVAQ